MDLPRRPGSEANENKGFIYAGKNTNYKHPKGSNHIGTIRTREKVTVTDVNTAITALATIDKSALPPPYPLQPSNLDRHSKLLSVINPNKEQRKTSDISSSLSPISTPSIQQRRIMNLSNNPGSNYEYAFSSIPNSPQEQNQVFSPLFSKARRGNDLVQYSECLNHPDTSLRNHPSTQVTLCFYFSYFRLIFFDLRISCGFERKKKHKKMSSISHKMNRIYSIC